MNHFIFHSNTLDHYMSKLVKTFSPPSSHIYLISPSKKFKRIDGCYESYARQAGFKNSNCFCSTPSCPAMGMNGAFPCGYEIATYIDFKNRHWNMPSRVSILTPQDKLEAFKFFKNNFSIPIGQLITAASRTAFYSVLSVQLKQITIFSTRSLIHLDLIIFTLFYIIEMNLLQNEIFVSYCFPYDPWNELAKFDPVWSKCKNSWLGRFMAYDALHAETQELKQKYFTIRAPLIKAISVPFVVHPLAINIENDLISYKEECIGELIMYGESFWLAKPTSEFLFNKALMFFESEQLVIITNEETNRECQWFTYMEELKFGRWRSVPEHKDLASILDLLMEYF